jgi:Leucine-rich repeat (LRR) protein
MKKIILIIALSIMPMVHSMEPVEAPTPEVAKVVGAPAQEQLSVQDLIDRNKLPAIEDGSLDLEEMGLTSLMGLENIPNPEQITSLDLEGNKIIDLPDHIFDNFINLTYLRLVNNPIIQIKPTIFEKLVNLEGLCLEDTYIVEIPPHTFDTLRMMKRLHLFNNKLESLPKGVIDRLLLLEEFDINDNKIEYLDPDLLINQARLESLTLSDNKLRQLPRITNLKNLKELIIANNDGITELPKDVIAFILKNRIKCNVPELLGEIPPYSAGQLVADLGDNWQNTLLHANLDYPGWFDLILDNQNLTDLSGLPAILSTMPICSVSAQNNYIKRISPEFFFQLVQLPDQVEPQQIKLFPSITMLGLSNNMIEELSLISPVQGGIMRQVIQFARWCPDLADLNLSGNKLKNIPTGSINGLRKLMTLDLAYNQINQIDDGALSDLGKLESLYLLHNKLHVLPTNIFRQLHRLNLLDLTHNMLGSKEQYVFPPNANVDFYPQGIPALKLLAAKKFAASFENKNIIEVYKALQAIPQEMHEPILFAASKNVALKIYRANRIQWLLRLVAEKPGLIHSGLLVGWPKDQNEAILAVAPENIRTLLIQKGFGSKMPGVPKRVLSGGAAPEEPEEESEEESFEFMDQ